MEKVLWAILCAIPLLCLLGMHAVEQKQYKPRWEREQWYGWE